MYCVLTNIQPVLRLDWTTYSRNLELELRGSRFFNSGSVLTDNTRFWLDCEYTAVSMLNSYDISTTYLGIHFKVAKGIDISFIYTVL